MADLPLLTAGEVLYVLLGMTGPVGSCTSHGCVEHVSKSVVSITS